MKLKEFKTNHGTMHFPVFFPDATEGFVKAMTTEDLVRCNVDGIVTNAYHLERIEKKNKIKSIGGIQNYMNFNKPAISDSGGFQVMSLIRDNGFGEINEDGIVFDLEGQRTELTPEKCIQIQLDIGTDIIMCLDDCTRYTEPREEQEKAVERTINWAKRCRVEFDRLTKNKENKPFLFGIIQGGNYLDLRKHCADELKKIGFDGYGWGGWSIDENGNLLENLAQFIADQMPDDKPKYAMGIGDPKTIIKSYKMGYGIFDCIVPTREARRQRLYYFKKSPETIKNLEEDFHGYFSVKNQKAKNNHGRISEFCNCKLCESYSPSELRTMFRSKDSEERGLAMRLASIHNLTFYSQLMKVLKRF